MKLAEARTQWLMALYLMAGYAIVFPASYIPEPTIRSVVVMLGFTSVIPGLVVQGKLAKWHGGEFKHFWVTVSSSYTYKNRRFQLWFKIDPVTTIEDATRYLPASEQARGWKRAKVYLDKNYPLKHPEFGKVWFIYIDFQGTWKERILQERGRAVMYGMAIPHNATDDIVLWEREANLDLNIPVIDIATQLSYPVYELRNATGDRKIVEDKRERRSEQILNMVGISR